MNTSKINEYLYNAQRHFNRREYEQFILPIVKLMEQDNASKSSVDLRNIFEKYINNVSCLIDEQSDKLEDGQIVIDVERVKQLLDTAKSIII